MDRLYSLYKKYNSSSVISTCAYFLSDRVQGIWDANRRYVCKKINDIPDKQRKRHKKEMQETRIAYVCDEMTYSSFSDLTYSVFLTPWNWYEVLEREQPDIFFCESAWTGIKKYEGCWRGRIYKSNNVKYNNRKVLFNILEYCRVHGIKTVFWNKEDPTFCGNEQYNFVDTALYFDYIFTTAEECVVHYQSLGHKNVYVLPFGVSVKLYNPINSMEKENIAIFAGSWYPEHKQRCIDTDWMFKQVLANNIRLEIYDRNYKNTKTANHFPEKYQQYISGYVPFEEMGKRIKHARFAVNVNSVTESRTMFARRVFEMMVSNVAIISNKSVGMQEMFGKRVWFIGESFEMNRLEEICKENVQDVLLNHTNQMRMRTLLNIIELLKDEKSVHVNIVRQEKFLHEPIIYKNVDIEYCTNFADLPEKIDFFLIEGKKKFEPREILLMLVHYQYLEKSVGIGLSGERYRIIESVEYTDTLIPYECLDSVKEGRSILKYAI